MQEREEIEHVLSTMTLAPTTVQCAGYYPMKLVHQLVLVSSDTLYNEKNSDLLKISQTTNTYQKMLKIIVAGRELNKLSH